MRRRNELGYTAGEAVIWMFAGALVCLITAGIFGWFASSEPTVVIVPQQQVPQAERDFRATNPHHDWNGGRVYTNGQGLYRVECRSWNCGSVLEAFYNNFEGCDVSEVGPATDSYGATIGYYFRVQKK